jgi:hypothetical protein
MTHDARFELKLPAASRRELMELAAELELTSADLVRLGLAWLLQHRGALQGELARHRETILNLPMGQPPDHDRGVAA